MVAIMASGMMFFMTLFTTLLREGFVPDFLKKWMRSLLISLIVVYPVALGMLQIAKKIVAKIMKQDKSL